MENYLLGGLATALAATITNPLDVAKTRLQIQGEMLARKGDKGLHMSEVKSWNNTYTSTDTKGGERKYRNVFHCLWKTASNEGIVAVQRGLIAACTYQFFMNGMRLGSYSVIKEYTHTDDGIGDQRLVYLVNALSGAASGMMGALFASPVYLAKTRLQAQGGGTGAVQHTYTGIWNVLSNVVKQRGLFGLYEGASAAMTRVAFGSGAQLATYDFSRRVVDRLTGVSGFPKVIMSAAVSGVFVSVMMNPMDVISTRMYNSSGLYKSMWDCIKTTVRNEGVGAFYKGMSAQYGVEYFLSSLYPSFYTHDFLSLSLKRASSHIQRSHLYFGNH